MDDYQELLVSMDGNDTYLLSEWKLWLEQYQSDIDNAILKMQSEIQYTGDTVFDYELFYNLWYGMKLLGEKLDRIARELINISRLRMFIFNKHSQESIKWHDYGGLSPFKPFDLSHHCIKIEDFFGSSTRIEDLEDNTADEG